MMWINLIIKNLILSRCFSRCGKTHLLCCATSGSVAAGEVCSWVQSWKRAQRDEVGSHAPKVVKFNQHTCGSKLQDFDQQKTSKTCDGEWSCGRLASIYKIEIPWAKPTISADTLVRVRTLRLIHNKLHSCKLQFAYYYSIFGGVFLGWLLEYLIFTILLVCLPLALFTAANLWGILLIKSWYSLALSSPILFYEEENTFGGDG